VKLTAMHPRVIRKNVVQALNHAELVIEMIGAEGSVKDWLKLYRSRNERATIPWWGMYPQLDQVIQRLDAAFQAVHDYRPEDYVSVDELSKIRQRAGKSGGDASAKPIKAIRAFAIRLYEEKKDWRSVAAARDEIWPEEPVLNSVCEA
jgi:hypothetical protein